jgi:hypothetical protein
MLSASPEVLSATLVRAKHAAIAMPLARSGGAADRVLEEKGGVLGLVNEFSSSERRASKFRVSRSSVINHIYDVRWLASCIMHSVLGDR